MPTVKVSLPADTLLPLPGGTWELLGAKWTRTEEPRWWYENGRIRADYTAEEAELAVGLMEVRDESAHSD
jgi:hypothetical protein